jgi:hypothetical protein
MGNFLTKQNYDHTINYNGEFWNYCEIRIPININKVPSIDRVNIHYRDGSETLIEGTKEHYSIKEYQKKYSIIGNDGLLYWKV